MPENSGKRKIILFMHMSLDGIISGPMGELDWATMEPEIGEYMIPDLLQTVDSMILGRNLYQGFSKAWPAMAANPNSPNDIKDFAHWIENSPKYVISNFDEKLKWENSKLITVENDDEIVVEINKLKNTSGKDFVLFGGTRIAQTFVKLDLIDEYRIKLEPIILGKGSKLFEDVNEKRKLYLTKAKAFGSGVMSLYYEK